MAPGSSVAPSRLVITDVSPQVDGGRHPVKRVVDEPVTVQATVFADGHDVLRCVVAHQAPGERSWQDEVAVAIEPGLDRWAATFVPRAEGVHRYRVLGWIDEWGSWRDGTLRKLAAEVPIESELLEGAALLEAAAERVPKSDGPILRDAADALRSGDTPPMPPVGSPPRPSATTLYHRSLHAAEAATSKTVEVLVERERALFNAWYELFPRSWSPEAGSHGTLRDVEAQLDYVADMGFDIVYLPPVHPIGRAFRKGPDNTEVAGPDDPGSPWAIGAASGGHAAIHPELGTIDDLRSLAKSAAANGMELALDFALQCSPDHPWVTEHPGWFRHRPDGSIQYAENPPKKYQDIYPLDFTCEDWEDLWSACIDLVLFWASQGISVFRVDNPHTKPFAFWERLIDETRQRHPQTIFLSEAFTRPTIMHRLAEVGFTLSYSYFPWRVSSHELREYFTELSTAPSVDRFRPSAWPTTPDILPWHLMDAPLEVFAARAFLAATLSPSYGIYGPAFELGDNRPAGNGKEEFARSEKYEIRVWDRTQPTSLRGLLTDLNRIRSEQRALHTLRTLRFHGCDNDGLLCYSKTSHAGPSVDPAERGDATIVVVANVEGRSAQAGTVDLDLGALGLDPDRPFEVHDLLTDLTFTWSDGRNYVELHPDTQPGHILRVSQT
jgi:starch synthase (maltosyl-transferring)